MVWLATIMAAWARGDGDAFASVFAEDADFMSLRGKRTHGRAAIAAAHNQLYSTICLESRVELDVEQIRYPRPDIAIVDIAARYPDRGIPGPDGKSVGSHSYGMAVVELRPPGWEIVAFQNMLPLGGALQPERLRLVCSGPDREASVLTYAKVAKKSTTWSFRPWNQALRLVLNRLSACPVYL